jgi:hypothetical protein
MRMVAATLVLLIAAWSPPVAGAPSEPPAKSYLRLFTKHDGSPGFINVNWYLRNASTSRKITATIRFTQANRPPWTRVVTLAPGEERVVGGQTGGGTSGSIGAAIAGAYYEN